MKRAEDLTIAELVSGDNRRRAEAGESARPRYAYLVRCWRERGTTATRGPLWRFSAEEVFGKRRRRGFQTLEALVAFIQGELREAESKPDQG
jgi:hypothetical protein